MRVLVFDRNAEVCAWVGNRLGMPDITGQTIGISDGSGLIAAVVYNGFTGRDVQGTIASITPTWATRGVLRAIFYYPFVQLGCQRITAATEIANHSARAFLSRLGFQQEGVLRDWFDSGDAALYGLLRGDCPWIKGLEHVEPHAA